MADRAVVVVGGGLAGAGAALELRRLGFDGRIALIGAEPHLPYIRPPLSKEFLRGEQTFEDALVAPSEEYQRADVELLLGRRAVELDATRRRVRIDSGEELAYARLLVATGGRKRRLPFAGAELGGVYDLRTVDDSQRIKAVAQPGRRVVVIGLGFIGCEVAASLRMLGLEVTAMDPGPVPLARVLGRQIGEAIATLHRARGVRLLMEEGVERLEGDGVVQQVVTRSGRRLDCDFVVAGIGIEPEVDLLKAAGAATSDGVDVDDHSATSLPDVFAAGDIANHQHPIFGRIRVEHWNNADRQGKAAAAALLGVGAPYDYVHSFWSDQFDQKLEYVGFAKSWERIDVDGSIEDLDFIARYYRGDRLLAAAAIGRGGDPEGEGESELKAIARQIRSAAPAADRSVRACR
jgi:3-phenylpropionate/trans-cinnamate dioxygenase ferredoxin reductase component